MISRLTPTKEQLALLDAELSGFKLVYQGGHHDVFCDGETHKITNGGSTKIEPRAKVKRVEGCDCARWRAPAKEIPTGT